MNLCRYCGRTTVETADICTRSTCNRLAFLDRAWLSAQTAQTQVRIALETETSREAETGQKELRTYGIAKTSIGHGQRIPASRPGMQGWQVRR